MLLWFFSILCFAFAVRLLAFDAFGELKRPQTSQRTQELLHAQGRLHSLEAQLQSGVIPSENEWNRLLSLPPPWGEIARENILELRAQGGAVLPSLARFRLLLEQNRAALLEGSARTAQALGQAWISAAIVPLLGFALYQMIPGLDQYLRTWLTITAVAFGVALLGARWIYSIANNARFGGLSQSQRSWLVAAPLACERFLAALRTGQTPDIAYSKAHALLSREAPRLAELWGANAYQLDQNRENTEKLTSAELASRLQALGTSLKSAVQSALLDGRPCGDRVEGLIEATRTDIKSAIDRELGLAATRTMLPLFLCVAPGILLLLAAALGLSAWQIQAL